MTGLSCGDIDDVSTRIDKGLRDQQCLFLGNPVVAHPVVSGNSH